MVQEKYSEMTDKLYQIKFDATITGEFDLNMTRRRFKKVFDLTQPALEKLFSGKELLIKKDLSEEGAMQFATKIADTGCECVIERIEDEGEEYYEENRAKHDRRIRFRRDVRPAAVIPDRRLNIRRKVDIEYFEELILNHTDIPIEFASYSPTVKERK
jgi:hypothetical protein